MIAIATHAAQELWAEWGAGRLCFQICTQCGRAQHPPGPVCGYCRSTSLSLSDVSGTAELVSWTTVYRAPAAAFAGEIPYTLALVRLAEGALVEMRVDDGGAAEWTVGLPVTVDLGAVNGRAMPVGSVIA